MSEPVLHNLLLTILHARVAQGDPGRYWIAVEAEKVVGVVLQSPLNFRATLTPMKPQVVLAMVDAISERGVALAGVNGDAATTASFAGQWSERRKSAATPFMGMRLYELKEPGETPRVEGELRQAAQTDRGLIIRWTRAFEDEIGESSEAVGRDPVQGVVRMAGVYTPPQKRSHGYAAACVHALSKHLRDQGHRCILYTDLANPTSNSIYKRIGYRAVAEALRYSFE